MEAPKIVLILEGPNGCAKTTLAKQLAAFFELPYVKESKPDQPGFQYYLERAKELGPCVLDRFHLGERVYPQLKNDGRVPLERWQQHEIERVLL
jgi:deoxyadenosine/deoxycytidine kinase